MIITCSSPCEAMAGVPRQRNDEREFHVTCITKCPVEQRTNKYYSVTAWDWTGTVRFPCCLYAVQCGTSTDTCGRGAGVDDALDTSDLGLGSEHS